MNTYDLGYISKPSTVALLLSSSLIAGEIAAVETENTKLKTVLANTIKKRDIRGFIKLCLVEDFNELMGLMDSIKSNSQIKQIKLSMRNVHKMAQVANFDEDTLDDLQLFALDDAQAKLKAELKKLNLSDAVIDSLNMNKLEKAFRKTLSRDQLTQIELEIDYKIWVFNGNLATEFVKRSNS